MHTTSHQFSDAAALLRSATSIAVLSGAGLSKASGIATYRDAGGLWQTDLVRFSTVEGCTADPAGAARFWKARRRELAKARPNAGHLALRDLQKLKPTTLVTQNVDGLLQEAGCKDVLELHGTLRRLRCSACGSKGPSLFARCLRCRGYMRPEVILFGEDLSPGVLGQAQEAASRCDLFIVVGTSAMVYPAADLPFRALRWDAKLMVLDPELPLIAKAAHVALSEPAESVLPRLVAAAAL